MTTLMFQARFVEPIRAGQKYQTIRPPRKRPIKVGDKLSLRTWQGSAYRSPQLPIREAICSAVFDIVVDEHGPIIGAVGRGTPLTGEALATFARADGFESWPSMREFFQSFYGFPFTGKLIQWVGQE